MAKIPGTFKQRPPTPYRDLSGPAGAAEDALVDLGALAAERWMVGECSVMCAKEPLPVRSSLGVREFRWHVSIAHPTRYPTWDEIKTAVYGIDLIALAPGRTFAQLLGNPKATGWLDAHPNCFHLLEIEDPWR